ncbi:MAG: DUF1800 domain-containing protein [Bryobacterales bacterium]|nr:DUF1800 domain-containing protein [Bryobacterales bacterium]
MQGVTGCSVLLLALAAPVLGQTVVVSVTPETATLRGGASRTFYASVSGTTNRAVAWSVNGVAGGNATVGTIDSNGVYRAPAMAPTPNIVVVRAVSLAAATAADTANATVLNPEPVLTGMTPSAVNVGAWTVTLTGRGFIPTSVARINDAPAQTTYVSATELRVSGNSTQSPDKVCITVANPNPGAAVSNYKELNIMPPMSISLRPETSTVRVGETRQFYASVQNAVNRTVKWYVNGVEGGNVQAGTISAAGLYTPPAVVPGAGGPLPAPTAAAGSSPTTFVRGPNTIDIKVVSVANPQLSATAMTNVLNPRPELTGLVPATLPLGQGKMLVTGNGFLPTSRVRMGGREFAVQYISPNQLLASGNIEAAVGGMATVTVWNPDPGAVASNARVVQVGPARQVMTAEAASRFLRMAAWGGSPKLVARLQETGKEAWIEEQFNAPVSTYPDAPEDMSSSTPLQQRFVYNAFHGEDQLRQRVAFALSQIFVVSGTKTGSIHQLLPYMRMLHQGAFGNYLDLLRNVTLHPTMGRFLDMVNNEPPDTRRNILPNENYAREVLQLFSIGLATLNPDGTPVPGAPPPYDEETVKQFTLAFTGWTYPTKPGATPRWRNPSYYYGPMEAWDDRHDKSTKRLLNGLVTPQGRTAREDMDLALQNIFQHPNVGPFIALRLIQRLTTSSPSPAYVGRVAARFNGNGGVRGDLRAVVRQILLDPEAGISGGNQGKLSEPVLFTIALLKNLGGTVTEASRLHDQATNMGQRLFYAPSVFNYFSPGYRIPGTPFVAPEFQITTPSVAMVRANFAYNLTRGALGSAIQLDLTEFERLAETGVLLEVLNRALLDGTMSAQVRQTIQTAMDAATDLRTKSRNALFLVGSSSQHQVLH